MSNKPLRIAILFHQAASQRRSQDYLIAAFAKVWSEDGHEVIYIFGVSKFILADVIIVHVDLSIVPEEYLEFALKYPVSVNARIGDIRKSAYSAQMLQEKDVYAS